MWPVGVILYEMLTGKHPFYSSGDSNEAYLERIKDPNYRPPIKLSE